ncbi:UPF0187 protein [Porphyridium purpureum]|uniref:UPF0187 protein n=1 Tax=Porphyridium purpureum TaxID=35688 RepID=A0A5J4YZB5_PORPP|nr:UPF0187 protein [Porphyridium purpureum]|eukprot:POR5416..scf208_2
MSAMPIAAFQTAGWGPARRHQQRGGFVSGPTCGRAFAPTRGTVIARDGFNGEIVSGGFRAQAPGTRAHPNVVLTTLARAARQFDHASGGSTAFTSPWPSSKDKSPSPQVNDESTRDYPGAGPAGPARTSPRKSSESNLQSGWTDVSRGDNESAVQRWLGNSEWVQHLVTLPYSYVLYRIRGRMLCCIAVSTFVTLFHTYHGLPEVSKEPHEWIAGALGLLNALSCGTAQDRFWESYRLFADLVFASRRMVRLACAYLPDSCYDVAKYTSLFVWTLKDHLHETRQTDLVVGGTERVLGTMLSPTESAQLRDSENRPLLVLLWLSNAVRDVYAKDNKLSLSSAFTKSQPVANAEIELFAVENCLEQFERVFARTEHLAFADQRTYSRALSRFLSLWTLTLPFVMVHDLGNFTPLCISCVAWVFYSIEELGTLLRNPFKLQSRRMGAETQAQLPMDAFCARLSRDILEILSVHRGMQERASSRPDSFEARP